MRLALGQSHRRGRLYNLILICTHVAYTHIVYESERHDWRSKNENIYAHTISGKKLMPRRFVLKQYSDVIQYSTVLFYIIINIMHLKS